MSKAPPSPLKTPPSVKAYSIRESGSGSPQAVPFRSSLLKGSTGRESGIKRNEEFWNKEANDLMVTGKRVTGRGNTKSVVGNYQICEFTWKVQRGTPSVGVSTQNIYTQGDSSVAVLKLPNRPIISRSVNQRPIQWGIALCEKSISLLGECSRHATIASIPPIGSRITIIVDLVNRSISIKRGETITYKSSGGLIPPDVILFPYVNVKDGDEVEVVDYEGT